MYTYKNHVVAFLDILGFSEMARQRSSPKAIEAIRLIDAKMSQVASEVRHQKFENGVDVGAKLFSDCICLWGPNSIYGVAAVLDSVALLSVDFARKGIFLRGGVAVGRHFQNERMIFSEALVVAYGLESKTAIWPRTIVDPSICTILDKDALWGEAPHTREDIRLLIRSGPADKLSFVDYLEYYSQMGVLTGQHPFDEHKDQLIALIETHKMNRHVHEKYIEAARYHNTKIEEQLQAGNSYVSRSMLIDLP